MVIIILSSLIGFTVTYRDKIGVEEVKTQLIDYKNTITKMVYDDIISGKLTSITTCVGMDNCVNFMDIDGNSHPFMLMEVASDEENNGSYISYDGVKYLLPDSELNNVVEKACSFTSFDLQTYNNRIYDLKVTYKHYLIEDEYEINLMIN